MMNDRSELLKYLVECGMLAKRLTNELDMDDKHGLSGSEDATKKGIDDTERRIEDAEDAVEDKDKLSLTGLVYDEVTTVCKASNLMFDLLQACRDEVADMVITFDQLIDGLRTGSGMVEKHWEEIETMLAVRRAKRDEGLERRRTVDKRKC